MGPVSAAIAGSAVGAAVSYVGNRNWSFRHRKHDRLGRETAMFLALNAVGIAVQAMTVYAFKHATDITGGVHYTSANALGLVLGTIFRFWSYRRWVWREDQSTRGDLS
jgi:putative flippase GtrA